VNLRSPRDAKNAGLALAPKNRHTESLLPGATVRENISLPNLSNFVTDPISRFIHRGRERAESRRIASRLAIKAPSLEASIDSLSGGNQQKAILGRWLTSGARVFMLNSPTAAAPVSSSLRPRSRNFLAYARGCRCFATAASAASCRAPPRRRRTSCIWRSEGRMNASTSLPRVEGKPRFDLAAWLARFGTIFSLVVLLVIFSIARTDVFPTVDNLLNIINQVSILGTMAFSLTSAW
jgi:hypothetical protein